MLLVIGQVFANLDGCEADGEEERLQELDAEGVRWAARLCADWEDAREQLAIGLEQGGLLRSPSLAHGRIERAEERAVPDEVIALAAVVLEEVRTY